MVTLNSGDLITGGWKSHCYTIATVQWYKQVFSTSLQDACTIWGIKARHCFVTLSALLHKHEHLHSAPFDWNPVNTTILHFHFILFRTEFEFSYKERKTKMAATATMRFVSSSTFSSNLAANKPTTRGGRKTVDQRPTLADMKNKTSRIPVNIAKKNDLTNQKSNQHACTKGRKARETAVETSETAKIPSSVTTRYRERTSTVTLEAKRVRGCHKRCLTEQQQKAVAEKLVNIPDVDSNDTDVQLCKEYVKDIYSNLLVIEREQYYTIKPDFMTCQTEVTSWHRAVLVDWLVLVQRKFHLLQETLHLCIDIMDRYLQVSHPHLVLLVCLLKLRKAYLQPWSSF